MTSIERNDIEVGAFLGRGWSTRKCRKDGSFIVRSYNCRGLKSSEEEIRQLFRGCDFLAVQEHWLLPCEFSWINSIDDDVIFSAVSPMEMDTLYRGRPFGGVALLWHKDLRKWTVPIETGSDRLSAALMKLDTISVLVVAVYMPVDYGNQQSFDDFTEQLGYLEGLASSVEFDTLICIGDFNTDFNNPSRFTRALNVFMSENDLQKVGLDSIGDTFSWASDDVTRTSWIDYYGGRFWLPISHFSLPISHFSFLISHFLFLVSTFDYGVTSYFRFRFRRCRPVLASYFSLLTSHFSFPISHFSLLTSHFLFLTSHFLFLTSRFLLLTSHFLFLTSYFSFPISYFSFPISHFSFLISYFSLPISRFYFRLRCQRSLQGQSPLVSLPRCVHSIQIG